MEKKMNYFGITFYEITGEQIAQWNMDNDKPDRFTLDLFEFVIIAKKDCGHIILNSDEHFQFFRNPGFLNEEQKKEKYILFDISTTDNMLTEEINQTDALGFLEMICFINCWEKIKNDILIHRYNDRIHIASDQFFVTETISSYNSYTGEYDYDIELIGYLNNVSELIRI
jgi:hypothetical protein